MAQADPRHIAGRPSRPGHRHRHGGQEAAKLFLLDLYGTAVGKKYVMAITGIIGSATSSPTWSAT